MQSFEPIFRITADFVHQTASTPLGWLFALLPILDSAGRDSKKLSKYRLAGSKDFASLLDERGTVFLWFQFEANRAASKALWHVVRIELELDDNGKIVDAFFNGEGCVISQASASMLLEKLQGKTVDEVKDFSAEDMLELYGPRLTPNRQKCCLLSWKVMQSAVHSPVEGGKQ